MNNILIAAAALSLLGASAASAQDDHRMDNRDNRQMDQRGEHHMDNRDNRRHRSHLVCRYRHHHRVCFRQNW